MQSAFERYFQSLKGKRIVVLGLGVSNRPLVRLLLRYGCTVTGCDGVITERHFAKMKNGAILTNAGHFDVEVDMAGLRKYALSTYEARNNIDAYVLPTGNTVYVLGEGRIVNLAAGDGHPAEIMDMSFAIQALSAKYLVDNRGNVPVDVIAVPRETDKAVAFKKLETLGITIDTLSDEQMEYLGI